VRNCSQGTATWKVIPLSSDESRRAKEAELSRERSTVVDVASETGGSMQAKTGRSTSATRHSTRDRIEGRLTLCLTDEPQDVASQAVAQAVERDMLGEVSQGVQDTSDAGVIVVGDEGIL